MEELNQPDQAHLKSLSLITHLDKCFLEILVQERNCAVTENAKKINGSVQSACKNNTSSPGDFFDFFLTRHVSVYEPEEFEVTHKSTARLHLTAFVCLPKGSGQKSLNTEPTAAI